MKSLFKRIVFGIGVLLIAAGAGAFIFHHKFFLLKSQESLSPVHIQQLSSLGSKALPSLDVPVASLLLYHDSIIGQGYNTVQADTNLTAHAEINALNAAVKFYGIEKFKQLDRSYLKLVTTYEPCAMCRAVLIACDIRQVEFVKAKPLTHWWKEDLKEYRYEWRKSISQPEGLQDSLFHLHPTYDQKRND